MTFGRWTCCWLGRVLVAECDDGRLVSCGELYLGRAILLHPESGSTLADVELAPEPGRYLLEQVVAALGGQVTPSVGLPVRGSRGHAPRRDQVLECVRRHPRGVAVRQVGRECGISSGAASQLLADLRRLGEVRTNGRFRSAVRYYPGGDP